MEDKLLELIQQSNDQASAITIAIKVILDYLERHESFQQPCPAAPLEQDGITE